MGGGCMLLACMLTRDYHACMWSACKHGLACLLLYQLPMHPCTAITEAAMRLHGMSMLGCMHCITSISFRSMACVWMSEKTLQPSDATKLKARKDHKASIDADVAVLLACTHVVCMRAWSCKSVLLCQ